MENNSLPKSNVFGGFKKKEVLSYIFELNENMQDSQQKLQEQADELAKSRDELTAALSESESRLTETRHKLDERNRELDNALKDIEESREAVSSLKEQLQRRDREIAEKDDSIARYATINAELAEKNRQFEEKSSKVESAAAQIGGMFVQAHEDADRVVTVAKTEADRITADAQTRADELVSEAQERADGLVSEAQSRADIIAAKAKASAEAYIDDANENLRGIYGRFSDFCSAMAGFQKTVLDATGGIRDKMDEISEAVSAAQNITPEIPDIVSMFSVSETENIDEPEQDPTEPAPHATPVDISLANDLLDQYGVHKDDFGFFRLADR